MSRGRYILCGKTPKECDNLMEWANWIENSDAERQVNYSYIGDVRVSTLFLGLDYQWGRGPPLLFETVVFGGEYDSYQERHSTWEDANRGHEFAVKLVMGDVSIKEHANYPIIGRKLRIRKK